MATPYQKTALAEAAGRALGNTFGDPELTPEERAKKMSQILEIIAEYREIFNYSAIKAARNNN